MWDENKRNVGLRTLVAFTGALHLALYLYYLFLFVIFYQYNGLIVKCKIVEVKFSYNGSRFGI